MALEISPLSETAMSRLFGRIVDTVALGACGGLLAVIPMLGAFVIWVPAAIFLALDGSWGKALILPTHPTALKARRSPRFPRCIYRAGCVHIIHPAIPARDIAVANNSESGNNGGAQAPFPLMGGQSSGKGARAR
jgi:hypothetical protein